MLIAHILYRLDIGGLETVLAHLVNRLPATDFRHAIICLTVCTDFRQRMDHPEITFHALNKQEGKDPLVWFRLWKLLKRLKPDLVHTLNLAALEAAIPARLAGVRAVIHAEHGRDGYDPDGSNPKYRLLRRLLAPFIDCFVPVSADLEQWLEQQIGVPRTKIRRIVNGVALPPPSPPRPRDDAAPFVIGTVGRMWPIKDHLTLVAAFARLRQRLPGRAVALVIVGDGPQRREVEALCARLGVTEAVRITGWRGDVPLLLEGFDLFVLSSRAEGTPLTILEAMAAARPVVATRVGGIPDLVLAGRTGLLVPPGDPEALADALAEYVSAPERAIAHGAAGRERVEARFSLDGMVHAYRSLFDEVLLQKSRQVDKSLFDFFRQRD